ncbi:MAG: nucleotidyltransferase domain-containing protein [Tepidisphaerales bacterium]
MVSMNQINVVVRRIAERFRPEKIILFGSYAYGHPNEYSDVDLLVLIKGHGVHDRSLAIREAIEADFAMDVICRSPHEYRERIAWGDWFLRDIDEKGEVLYDAAHARVGDQGRGRLPHRTARSPRPKAAQSR